MAYARTPFEVEEGAVNDGVKGVREMTAALAGNWVWIWNWRRCEGGDPARVAARLQAAGCSGALVKAYDGARWFDQGVPWREIARALRTHGLAVGGWGYHYGKDIAGEARRAIETMEYGEADLLVLDVESEFEGRPAAARELSERLRDAVGAGYPLYFSSFAIPRYHRSFPYDEFRRHGIGTAPQLYWNAFGWPMEQALARMYEGYADLGFGPEETFPVAGLYREGSAPYPSVQSVQGFIRETAARGYGSVSFWSYEHMDEAMWQAVAGPASGDGEEISSREFQQVNRSLAVLTGRVERLEAEVSALGGSAAIAPRIYTVRLGDTLAAIADHLGLAGWQALYEANRDVIGGDPNRIRAGQSLVIPSLPTPSSG